jgi:heme/copper-type cytochrome/quinol oxidase subunit 4
MKQTLSSNYILLLILTVVAALVAINVTQNIKVKTVVGLAILKFWLVAFQFMELKKAHPFWKFLIILFGIIFGLIIMIIL